MDQVVTIFTDLIIAFLGFIFPLLGTLFAIFRGGAERLKGIYQSEVENRKKAILEKESEREREKGSGNVAELSNSITSLRKEEKRYEKRIQRLSPLRQTALILVPMFVALISSASYFVIKPTGGINGAELTLKYVICGLLIFSLIAFVVSLRSAWHLIEVIVEVRRFVTDDHKEHESKKIKLLEELISKIGHPKGENVNLFLCDKDIKEVDRLQFAVGTEGRISFVLKNEEKVMLKKIECGVEIQSGVLEFVACSGHSCNIYEGRQTVKCVVDSIHSNDSHQWDDLVFKCLKEGEYELSTFIKAENIGEPKYNSVLITVTGQQSVIVKKDAK